MFTHAHLPNQEDRAQRAHHADHVHRTHRADRIRHAPRADRVRPTHRAARRIALLLSLLLVLGTTGTAFAATSYPDVPETAYWKASVDRLTMLGILSGTTSGQFLPDTAVTREQFAKMAVTAANEASDDQIRCNSTGFSDVASTRWSSGYIRTAVELGFFTGYPDGRFHPADTVTYAQSLTIALRMLGYDTASLSGTWPQNVLTKAASLKLTTGFSYPAAAPMTRKDVAILLARLLETRTASSANDSASGTSGSGVKYAQSTGLYRTMVVLSTPLLDTSLEDDEIAADIGTLTNSTTSALPAGRDFLVKLDGTDITKVYGPASYTLSYTVSALSDSTLYYGSGAGA